MAVVEGLDQLKSLRAIGKYGKPNFFGNIFFGVSWFGDDNIASGIYMRRHKGTVVEHVRMKHYWCNNPQWPTQQTWRQVFADGMTAWGNLTAGEKAEYNEDGKMYQLPGYSYFLKQYLREHRLP